MAYVIAAPCVDHTDQSCVQVCPVDCIYGDPSVDRKLYIDPDACIDCGSCESACPNSAIVRAERLPGAWADFAWVDATWFADPDAARAVVDELVPAA
jgi:NAD-dependent dihydropyrimidine dehydrogenase PreA subunit